MDVTLADAGHASTPATKTNYACAVHKHDEWIPQNEHHVWPQGMGGPNVASNRITVCTNGHYMIHEFMRQLILHAGSVPWDIAQHFGPRIRQVAHIGWIKAGSPTKGTITE